MVFKNALLLALLVLPAAARAELSVEGARALDDGLRALYGLDYEASRKAFRSLVEREPDNPFGYLFESGGIWWQSSMEYGLFKDTPTLQGLFEQDVEAAVRKADAWTDAKEEHRRADGHFVLGMALGTRGQWHLMRGNPVRAYFDGKKAIKHLKKCLKLRDDYYDAELGLGVFDYQAAQMSGILKFSAAIGGMRGDEKRGLEKIRLATEKGRYGSRQATQLLMMVYLYDKHDFAAALPLVRRLRKDFPQSVYFAQLEAVALERTGDLEGSYAAGREVFEHAAEYPHSFAKKLLSLLCGAAGPHCLSPKIMEPFARWIDALILREEAALAAARKARKSRKPAAGPSLVERERLLQVLVLWRGHAADVLGRREAADADYKRVLAGPEVGDVKKRAKECLTAPCVPKSILAYARALSKGDVWPYAADALEPGRHFEKLPEKP